MDTNLTADRAALVDREYHWRDILTDPPPGGAKAQLINKAAGVAQYGSYNPRDTWYTHWAPLPTFKKDEA
jgi:hypothetical protein